jgi:hypothetical protein
VQARYTHIEDTLYLAAHDLCGYYGLASHREIRRARANDKNTGRLLALGLRTAVNDDTPRHLFVAGLRHFLYHGIIRLLRGSRYKQAVRVLQQSFGYGHYMLRRLALTEYDLREALPQGAMVVNLGEVQVFKRQVYEARDDIILTDAVRLEIPQHGAQARLVYDRPPLEVRPLESSGTNG